MISNRVKRMFENLEKQQQEISVETVTLETVVIESEVEGTEFNNRSAVTYLVNPQIVIPDVGSEVTLLPQDIINESTSIEEHHSIEQYLVDPLNDNNSANFLNISAKAIMSAPIIFSDIEYCAPLTAHMPPTEVNSVVDLQCVANTDSSNPENSNDCQAGNSHKAVNTSESGENKRAILSIIDGNLNELEPTNSSDEDYVPEPESSDSLEPQNTHDGPEVEKAERNKSRKRKRNEQNWPRSIRKQHRNLGKSYETSKKKIISERSLQEPCTDACKQNCTQKISDAVRSEILTSFWNLGDVSRQRQFICNHTQDIEPKYRYVKENSQRQNRTQAYYFHVNNERIRVCKKYFMATLNIGDTMIRTAFKKCNDKKIVGPDLRGKHGNHKKLDSSLKDGVRQHIESLPTVESHYLRQQTERTYIEGNLNLATLYRDYKRECEESGKPFVKACIYENIFNFEYNIGWHRPKKDQCSMCERYANSSSEEKQILQNEYNNHIANKNKSREEKQKDVSHAFMDENKLVAVYDLQAVLSTPCSEVSDFYYKSKLATYNFTIFDIGSKEGFCYVWSENVARRGANEIGSCLLQFLERNCKEKHVTFYSDNCAGQNKNKYIASLYLYATAYLKIPTITHKFLITGHTQNEGDSMHSCIEKEKKRILKGGPIYIPAQWIPVIQGAKKKGKAYSVKEMDQSEFFDIQRLSSDIGKNFTLDSEKRKVKWTEIKVIMAMATEPNTLYFKYEYGEDIPYNEIKIYNKISLRSSSRNSKNESQFTGKLWPAYSEELTISKQKKDGLVALCQKNLIPKPYQDFYRNLLSE